MGQGWAGWDGVGSLLNRAVFFFLRNDATAKAAGKTA